MPIKSKSTPGPRGESCLTCRQRRKKCDKGRPFCERCLSSKGRFTCLGYDDELELEEPPREKERTGVAPVKIFSLPQVPVGVEFEDAIPDSYTRSAYFGFPVSASEMNDYLSPSMDSLMVPGPPASGLLTAAPPTDQQGAGWRQITPQTKARNVISLPLPVSIPRGVSADKQMRENYLIFILDLYEHYRIDKFFRRPTISMREYFSAKMKRSRILGFMYLGAKIFETLEGKPAEAAIQSCSQWVTRYSNHVSSSDGAPNPYPSIQEVEDRLNGLLELIFLKFIVLGTTAGYATLRLALPNFLRLVSNDPKLWAEQERHGLLCVSLPAALTSHQLEIRRFVFYDVMCAFVLGLQTLAEYDSTGFPISPRTDLPVEWVHGVPIELIVNIAEVHNWRAQAKYVDWRVLEMRTLAWKWNHRDVQSEESAEMIHRIAIQEAWRHVTLIYIYMGMCGVDSHNASVQASVDQIIKLMRVVGDAHLDVHFSIPCLVAGLAARYEPQRAFILQKLQSFHGKRVWSLRGQDFARVLECLWYGLAVAGAAIGWEDYVQARCQALPIR
ncbi:unnamed protein product [Rhizoctonia solani]|uniref:Zn(2)-C6 fungal-type domain-containing protein n=1 Tax=Rhizoctonia solani TaxID=456999 RepID=A0A8H3BE37_9AGAM|nr:unnamed protein product [Rhizoctonia solani]